VAQKPFFLVLRDDSAGTFSVEGPMTDDRPWISQVVTAQRAGRKVRCVVATGATREECIKNWLASNPRMKLVEPGMLP
jgi:hypothetical protein